MREEFAPERLRRQTAGAGRAARLPCIEREKRALLRSRDGDAIVYATSSEPDPQTTAGNNTAHWPYLLPRFTQYWRIPAHDLEPDLRVRVNARRVYWQSKAPVLGGIAFENFEVQERYVAGQTFVFGISQQQPWQLDPELDTLEKTLAGSSDDQK